MYSEEADHSSGGQDTVDDFQTTIHNGIFKDENCYLFKASVCRHIVGNAFLRKLIFPRRKINCPAPILLVAVNHIMNIP